MGRAFRVFAVFCAGVAAVALAACSTERTSRLPLDLGATVTQVIPFDTATSGSGDAEADTVTASDPDHLCPPDDAGADSETGAHGTELPPLPPCSTDPVIH